ncbi:hypothetical protein GCM10007394_16630 [Salinibacterium amurskyense]|nr:hypothetical protein GCM10007394_16630 [Salinibacterium amurskyense]
MGALRLRRASAPPPVLDAERCDDPRLERFKEEAGGEHPILPTAFEEIAFEGDDRASGAVVQYEFADDGGAFAFGGADAGGLPVEAGDSGRVDPDGEDAEAAVVAAVPHVELGDLSVGVSVRVSVHGASDN